MQNVTAVKRPAITYSCVVFCKLLYLKNIINTGRAEENLANCYRCGESWKLFHLTKVLQSLTTVLCSAVVMAERGLQTITIVEIHAKGFRYWKSCKLIQPWRALQTFLRLQRNKLIRLWIVLQTFTAVESLAIFLTIVERAATCYSCGMSCKLQKRHVKITVEKRSANWYRSGVSWKMLWLRRFLQTVKSV